MWLLCAAAVFAVLKLLAHLDVTDIGGISQMSWWWVVGGFALTAAWFAYADASGLTRRKAIEKMDERKKERLQKQRDALRAPRKR
jgi:small Trp-rich protein